MQISKCSKKGHLNDLWAYNITAKNWNWVSGTNKLHSVGIFSAIGESNDANLPGSRYAAALVFDQEAHALHLFFGYGYTTSLSKLSYH